MRYDLRTVDVGIRDLVAALNRIPGVATRASCEGGGRPPVTHHRAVTHRHADLAYVLLQRPMPLRLQDFLLAQHDPSARIEDDGIYSRWPAHNVDFVDRATAAVRAYGGQLRRHTGTSLRWSLPKVRARLAHELSRNAPVHLGPCTDCKDLVTTPHPERHRSFLILHILPDQEAVWFAEFAGQHGNALDPALIAADGWAHILERTHRGDFGVAFSRRWLRYRARMIGDLSIRQLRSGVGALRRQGLDIDFFCTGTHAVFVWRRGQTAAA